MAGNSSLWYSSMPVACHHVIPGLPEERENLFNKYSISTISPPNHVPNRTAMCWTPLGKFNSHFSIVSALRGQYITVNEPCQFYYQWSTAPQIKTRLHILPHLPGLTKQPCLISLLLQAPSLLLSQPSGPCFSFCLSLSVF